MGRAVKGGVIGFLAGAALEFVVVTGALSGADNEDVANYSWLIALLYSPAAALVGGVIGTLIGAVMDWREGQKSPLRLFSLVAGVVLFVGGSLGVMSYFLGGPGAIMHFFCPWHHNVRGSIAMMVTGLLLWLAAGLVPHHAGSR